MITDPDVSTQSGTDGISTTDSEVHLVFDEIMAGNRERKSRLAFAAMLGAMPQFDLALVGTSIHGLGALTLESLSYLVAADVVFYYPPSPAHFELMKLLNENVVNVHETFYVRGKAFDPAYDSIITDVMDHVRRGKKVAYATQGSPAFLCGTCVSLYRRAKWAGFSPVMVSGISSLELLMAQLTEHNIVNLQIYSIVDLMKGAIAVDPRVPCLLCNLGRYALPGIRESFDRLSRSKLKTFLEFMGGIYPPEHELELMFIKSNGSCMRAASSLRLLEEALFNFNAVPTLFVPGLQKPVGQAP